MTQKLSVADKIRAWRQSITEADHLSAVSGGQLKPVGISGRWPDAYISHKVTFLPVTNIMMRLVANSRVWPQVHRGQENRFVLCSNIDLSSTLSEQSTSSGLTLFLCGGERGREEWCPWGFSYRSSSKKTMLGVKSATEVWILRNSMRIYALIENWQYMKMTWNEG